MTMELLLLINGSSFLLLATNHSLTAKPSIINIIGEITMQLYKYAATSRVITKELLSIYTKH
jgi:hypothetical protein